MEPIQEPPKKKETEQQARRRRTKEELIAFHQAQLQRYADDDKREVIRLLSGISDDIAKVSTYTPAKGVAAELTAAQAQIKSALTKVSK